MSSVGGRVRVYVNGKFLAQRMTGVQRTAACLVHALDGLGPALPGRWTVLHPPGAAMAGLGTIEPRAAGRARASLHAWEQFDLPRAARDGLLLNLAGSAPWAARRQACLIHDAAPFDVPQAYTRSFVLWYRWLFRHLARRANPLMTVSAFSRQRLALALGTPEAAWHVVPNGADHLDGIVADPGALAAAGLQPGGYLLAVASRNPAKNLDLLLHAHARPGSTLPPLVLAGGSNPRVFASRAAPAPAAMATAAGGGVDRPPAAGVRHLGTVSDEALKALYAGAVALLLPSTYEGFGLTAVEAMACGCPVVALRAAALPEVCGDAAWWVAQDDPAAWADAMRRLVADAPLRARLRAAGQRRVAGLRWQRSAEMLVAALATSGGGR
jgi:glycosyltransferase involved in cell wall biosynthesis